MHSNFLSSLNSHSCWEDLQFFVFEYAWNKVLKIEDDLKHKLYKLYTALFLLFTKKPIYMMEFLGNSIANLILSDYNNLTLNMFS